MKRKRDFYESFTRKKNPFDDVPDEILLQIFEYLTVKEQITLIFTCKRFCLLLGCRSILDVREIGRRFLCNKSTQEIHERLTNLNLGWLVQLLQEAGPEKAVMAGGSVLQTFFNQIWENSDIDIFITEDAFHTMNLAERIHNIDSYNNPVDRPEAVEWGYPFRVVTCSIRHPIIIYRFIVLQFIVVKDKTPLEHVHGFDLNICKVYFDGLTSNIHTDIPISDFVLRRSTIDFELDHETMLRLNNLLTTNPNPSFHNIPSHEFQRMNTLNRIKKYIGRGFTFYILRAHFIHFRNNNEIETFN